MTDAELDAVVAGITDAVLGHVRKELASIFTRLDAQEKAQGPSGPAGPPGEKGADGAPGQDGAAGPQGDPGPPGDAGAPGARGEKGLDGAEGPRGPQGDAGRDGQAGRDGLPGVPGVPGEKGLDGKDGRDGLDGKDGLGFDDLEAVYDECGRMSLKFVSGDRVKVFRVPCIVDRGVYKSGDTYELGDAVTWGGSYYVAQKATTAKPGEASLESRAWRLTVKRGGDGKAGPQGPVGPQGPRGDQGPQGRSGF